MGLLLNFIIITFPYQPVQTEDCIYKIPPPDDGDAEAGTRVRVAMDTFMLVPWVIICLVYYRESGLWSVNRWHSHMTRLMDQKEDHWKGGFSRKHLCWFCYIEPRVWEAYLYRWISNNSNRLPSLQGMIIFGEFFKLYHICWQQQSGHYWTEKGAKHNSFHNFLKSAYLIFVTATGTTCGACVNFFCAV